MIERTLHESAPNATHWTVRGIEGQRSCSLHHSPDLARARAEAAPGRDLQAVQRLARFVEKVRDIVGLYEILLSAPWCCRSREELKIQALDRTQPGLPMKQGRCGTMTHDYKRHGTTTLFAALDVKAGKP